MNHGSVLAPLKDMGEGGEVLLYMGGMASLVAEVSACLMEERGDERPRVMRRP